jgi:enoyl-CoA hydratase/carnithine racemase
VKSCEKASLTRCCPELHSTELGDGQATARAIIGADALAYGMASHCVPLAELDATVDELAAAIAANASNSIAAYKDLYRNQQDLGLTGRLGFEYDTHYPMRGSTDRVAGFGNT